ncbi:unnamed protein product, partial [Lymnaea stagnalis]
MQIEAVQENNAVDRTWNYRCGGSAATSTCNWSPYVNNWHEMVAFICPGDTVITGVDSYHDELAEDRRYKFRCCGI